jgi:hypothetical protein
MSLFPPPALRLWDSDVLPVQELSHFWGAQSGGGETPVERSRFFEYIFTEPKIIVFRYNAGIVTPQSIIVR